LTRLDEKLTRIRSGRYTPRDFIIADAKDADMGPSLTGTGPRREKDGSWTRYRTRREFLDCIRAVVAQDIVDIMLVSASNLEVLTETGAFHGSLVKPVIRANDTTDIWVVRGAGYNRKPSRPFRTASLPRVRSMTDLGLYSITFNHDLDHDYASLQAFEKFRADAQACGFRYFLEVFNPNVACGIDDELVPHFINDSILRCLAGLTRAERPEFLKMAYNGPKALEELASYDPSLIVGVLGGGAGTARDVRASAPGGEIRRAGGAVRPQDQSCGVPAGDRPADARSRRWQHPARGGGTRLSWRAGHGRRPAPAFARGGSADHGGRAERCLSRASQAGAAS
jgi:hypothetical protein